MSEDLLDGLDIENYQALVMDMAQANGPVDEEDSFEWDPTMEMSDEEKEQWQRDILPVKRALLKVSPLDATMDCTANNLVILRLDDSRSRSSTHQPSCSPIGVQPSRRLDSRKRYYLATSLHAGTRHMI